MVKNGLIIRKNEYEIKKNSRVKIYKNGYMQITVCSDRIYVPSGYEKADDYQKNVLDNPLFDDVSDSDSPTCERIDSIIRARRAIFDISMMNDFTHFATGTFSPEKIDRYDDEAVKKRMVNFLSNSVQRKNLLYLFVPERHKDGAVHWHALIKGDYEYIDSGKVSVKGYGEKPVGRAYAERKGLEIIGTVYNIADWRNGWSTALELYGNRENVSKYITKYITKESLEKIYGNYYFAGGHGLIRHPDIVDVDIDFAEVDKKMYSVEGLNRSFKYLDGYSLDDIPFEDSEQREQLREYLSGIVRKVG